MTTTPSYAVWMTLAAPCWRCGARRGQACVSKSGKPSAVHAPRQRIASADRERERFNAGYGPPWQMVVAPPVFTLIALHETVDDHDPKQPIRPGETYYAWTPDSYRLLRSRTQPVQDDAGILFWPMP